MSKLFKLKEWLTIADAAKHLSIVLGEAVTPADILQLVLNRHLVLSVNFINHASAKKGKVVPPSEVKRVASLFVPGNEVMLGDELSDGNYMVIEDQIVKLEGVWDLAMIGSERLDVEHELQLEIDGPEVTLVCLDGTFVQSADGSYYQIQSVFNKKELEEIYSGKQVREGGEFFPAGGLPRDSMLVVRTEMLRKFEESLNSEKPKSQNKSAETKIQTTLLKIIHAMAIDGYRYDHTRNSSVPKEITEAAERLGLDVTVETVRKWLKKSADLLN